MVSGDKSFQVVLLRKVMSKKLALCDEIIQVFESERSNISSYGDSPCHRLIPGPSYS